jgi:hypothetical protein
MNRRKLLSLGGQAAIGLMVAPLALKATENAEPLLASESFNGGPRRKYIVERPNTPNATVYGPLPPMNLRGRRISDSGILIEWSRRI